MTTEDLRAAIVAGVRGAEQPVRPCCAPSSTSHGRSSRKGIVHPPALPGQRRARVRGGRRRGRAYLVGRDPRCQGSPGGSLGTSRPSCSRTSRRDPRFAREVGGGTGRAHGLMAVPLLLEEEMLGVLQVLDRPERARSPCGRWSCSGCSRPRRRSRSPSSGPRVPARASLAGDGRATAVARLAGRLSTTGREEGGSRRRPAREPLGASREPALSRPVLL